MVRYYQWKEDDDGYLTKLIVEADADEVLGLWKSMVETLKEHSHYKRRLFKETRLLKVRVTMEEILIHLGYSESYTIIAKAINSSIKAKSKELQPATLLKVTLLHGCFFTFFKLCTW